MINTVKGFHGFFSAALRLRPKDGKMGRKKGCQVLGSRMCGTKRRSERGVGVVLKGRDGVGREVRTFVRGGLREMLRA